MKKTSTFFTVAALVLTALAPAFAANADPGGCDVVLNDGIYSYRASQGDHEARQDVVRFLLNTSYDQFQTASGAGGGASFLGFGFDASMSRSQFEEHKKELRTSESVSGFSKDSQQLLERYGDTAVLAAWSSCKSRESGAGMHSWIDRKDATHFVLCLKYIANVPGNTTVANSVIQNGKVTGGTAPVGQIIPKGSQIPPGITKFLITREDTSKPISIAITIAGMDVDEFVPSVIPPVQPDQVIQDASRLDGNHTGYVMVNPQLGGLVTHDNVHPATVPDNAGYSIVVPKSGPYELFVTYASSDSRPTEVLVDNVTVLKGRLSRVTGGDSAQFVHEFSEGFVTLQQGPAVINIFRRGGGKIPSLKSFRLVRQQ